MPNAQLIKGGAALALLFGANVASSPGFSITVNQFAIVAGGGSVGAGNPITPAGEMPAVGGASTVGGYTLAQPTAGNYTLTAALGASPATATNLQVEVVPSGSGGYQLSQAFDTVAGAGDLTPPVPLSASVNAAGTQLTLAWTEAASAPVLQAAGQGTSQGLTLTATDGASLLSAVTTTGTATTATLSRAIQQGEILTLAGAAGAFTDSAGVPNASAAFAGLTVANGSTQALTAATPSSPKHVFSTGTLVANWTDGGGNPQTATFAVLQDVSTDLSFTRKDLMDAAQISIFPVDSADSDGKLVLKAGIASIRADTLQRLIAAALTAAAPGGTATLVLPKEVKLPAFQAVLTLQATDGKTVTATAGVAKALGVQIALKLADFAMSNFELHCYPDANGIVGTWTFQN